MFDNEITTIPEGNVMISGVRQYPITYVSDIDLAWTLAQDEDARRNERTSQGRALAAMHRRESEVMAELARLREQNAQLNAQLSHAQVGDIDISDPRLTHIWIAAAKAANTLNQCSEYDRTAGMLGIPTRDELREQGLLSQTYDVEVRVELSTWITVQVQATDERNAIDEADHLDTADIWDYLDTGALDSGSIDSWDAREAEEVDE